MRFISDKQTLEDLNLIGRFKSNSISRIFDQTVTAGGSRRMEEIFQSPLVDAQAINKRVAIFSYFNEIKIAFPFNIAEFEELENYLRSASANSIFTSGSEIAWKRMLQVLADDKVYEQLQQDVAHAVVLLKRLAHFLQSLNPGNNPYKDELDDIKQLFAHPKMKWLKEEGASTKPSFFKLVKYDFLFRATLREEMQRVLSFLYQLDVNIAVAAVAHDRNFTYAEALPAEDHIFEAKALYHPALAHAQGNDVNLSAENNVLFFTGANMAGKSTLMKAIGIATHLAHMGFPVAAGEMRFSVKDGLYTSINVPDNIGMGYSHFYAEVLRVKKVAEEVASGKNLLAIFDELFKGTNVKDAYDATLAITEAFSESDGCFFVVSTHIIEVAETLSRSRSNFSFAYLSTILEGNVPRYTYQLQQGITADRQGMTIIINEGILQLLED
jgi:DNA mismatch repair protein MutS